MGLVLAPEVVEWHTPVSLGTPSPTRITQRRICFTELSEQELSEHSRRFGPFALEFETIALRRVGALPVIYMPQALSEQDHLALLGPFVVSHLDQIRGALDLLNRMDQPNNPAFLRNQGADGVTDDCVVTLTNVDDFGKPVQTFHIPWTAVRDILSVIRFKRAPFDAMMGVTSIAQSLFYPTDDDYQNTELGYYRQREWRITADYFVNGTPRGRNLEEEEKKLLLRLDDTFWGKNIHSSRPIPRIDEALVLVQPTPAELLDDVTRIIVPDDFAEQARQIFGDRVATASELGDSSLRV